MRLDFTEEKLDVLRQSIDDANFFTTKYLDTCLPRMHPDDPIHQDMTLTTRQLCAYTVWHLMFRMEQTIMYMSPNAASRKQASGMVVEFLRCLPDWMSITFREQLQTRLILKNNSRVHFVIPDPYACKGMSLNMAIFDQYSDYNPKARAETMTNLLPVIVHNTHIVVAGYEEMLAY